MSYDPKGPVAKILEPLLANELASTYGITEDAQDTAEYINDRIGQGKSASEICADVKDVVNIPIDEAFIGRVFVEIARLQQIHASGQPLDQPIQQPQQPTQQLQEQQQQQQQPQQQQQTFDTQPFAISTPAAPNSSDMSGGAAAAPNPFFPNGTPVFAQSQPQAQANDLAPKAFPSGPAKQNQKGKVDFHKMGMESRKSMGPKGKASRGGVGKDYDSKNGKNQGRKAVTAANLQRTLNLASDEAVNFQPFSQRAPKGRCPDFPKCFNKECPLAHPQKKCLHYPKCKNPPGTCDYLHPSEDQELMQEINKNKSKFQRRAATIVELCKFGVLCSKELCPFGHPTPANKHAKVMVQNWCRMNKNCNDENCEFAHSSPNYQAPAPTPVPAPAPVAAPAAFGGAKNSFNNMPARRTTSLEQCKFGKMCTSALCPKRHNTSLTPCRSGYNCTRLTCTFAHPIMEDCRFGLECTNKTCYYKHPDNREAQHFNAGAVDNGTANRTFSVPEDQVMEQAVQQ